MDLNLDQLVLKVRLVDPEHKELLVLLEILGLQVIKDLLEELEIQGLKEHKEVEAQLEELDHLEEPDLLEVMDLQAQADLVVVVVDREDKAHKDQVVDQAQQGQPVDQDLLVDLEVVVDQVELDQQDLVVDQDQVGQAVELDLKDQLERQEVVTHAN